jgi:integrase
MGPQHVRDGVLSIRQQKTGTEVVIPVHGNLLASLDATRSGEMVFLLTSQGRAFTANGFGNFFRDAVESAGLRGLSAHGLRKAACRRLAEAGCSAHEIMSISGHVSLREVQRYTMAANREQMARSAFQKLGTSQNKNSQT